MVDTTIHFDEGVTTSLQDEFLEAPHFLDGMLDELLSSKAWIDRHEEHHINVLDDVFEDIDRSVGIEGYASLHPCIVYLLDGAMKVGTSFVMYVHHVCSEGFDLLRELAWVNNHQVDVKRLLANLGDGLKNGKSETDVGHENAVHDVEVEPVGFTTVNHINILGQVGEVSRKEGWGNGGHIS